MILIKYYFSKTIIKIRYSIEPWQGRLHYDISFQDDLLDGLSTDALTV